mmetsp:Transcript_12735/g.37477  ORF Transcript_12735/g.37477 Transcript_12735/m.37477 type:complete len:86 (-) Transcript_12735:1636-1893(-)
MGPMACLTNMTAAMFAVAVASIKILCTLGDPINFDLWDQVQKQEQQTSSLHNLLLITFAGKMSKTVFGTTSFAEQASYKAAIFES